jgi:hypothetical protein
VKLARLKPLLYKGAAASLALAALGIFDQGECAVSRSIFQAMFATTTAPLPTAGLVKS